MTSRFATEIEKLICNLAIVLIYYKIRLQSEYHAQVDQQLGCETIDIYISFN